MSEIVIAPMTARYAADILAWRYPPPYDCYNVTGGDPGYYLDPANRFFAVLSGGEFIGFRSFGPDGQVPGGNVRRRGARHRRRPAAGADRTRARAAR